MTNPSIIALCRHFRQNQTLAEKVFWESVRNRRFRNLKFNRQFPIPISNGTHTGHFIADFYCHEYRLIVEIDGGIHEKQKEYDRYRTMILEQQNFFVVRFINSDVLNSLDLVLEKLENHLDIKPK